ELKDYKVSLKAGSPDIRLLAPLGATELNAPKPYYALFGWAAGGDLDPALVPGARTQWQLAEGDRLAPDHPVTIAWDNGAGLVFRRTFAIDEDFMFTVTQTGENRGTQPVRLAPYGVIARHGLPKLEGFYIAHDGAIRLSDGKLQELDYDEFPELPVSEREGLPADAIDVATDGWVGFTDKYFMASLVPSPGQPFTSVLRYTAAGDVYEAWARQPTNEVAPGNSATASTMLFACSKE